MAMFKKMMLLNHDEFERIKSKQLKEYSPNLNAMARLQTQLETVLNDPDMDKLAPADRLKIVQLLQHRFTELKNDGAATIPLASVSSGLPPEEKPSTDSTPEHEKSDAVPLIGIAQRYKKRALHLINLLSKAPEILSVNDRGQIVVKGQPIPDSNFQDLLSDAFASSKLRIYGERPPGFHEFVSALREINAPRTLFVNPRYNAPSSHFERASRTFERKPKVLSRSFERKPKVLSLYK